MIAYKSWSTPAASPLGPPQPPRGAEAPHLVGFSGIIVLLQKVLRQSLAEPQNWWYHPFSDHLENSNDPRKSPHFQPEKIWSKNVMDRSEEFWTVVLPCRSIPKTVIHKPCSNAQARSTHCPFRGTAPFGCSPLASPVLASHILPHPGRWVQCGRHAERRNV